ncbi:MAG TPA: S8 family serine peptidase, partial [Kribbella sp.]
MRIADKHRLGVALAAALALTVTPAMAQPSRDPGTTQGILGWSDNEDHQVTLITGDVVHVSVVGGKTSVAVDSADGGAVQAYTQHGETYVVPERVAPYLRAGSVDRELFNVTKLIAQGRADERTAELPVIVTYAAAQSRSTVLSRSAALPASDPSVALPSIDGAGLSVAKAGAKTFWSAVDGAAGTLDRGLEKIWLDGSVRASLDVSVPQIGAPVAWQAGYDGTGTQVAVLDTGADTAHPDLAGRIGLQADFTEKGSIADGHGHGTHVAATVAGSGAASGGSRKGAAPGAELMIGKVLDDGGSGLDSAVIAGMEWAANNGADVVNMSLGSNSPSNGFDLISEVANELTDEYHSLFVAAAGNLG